VSYKTFEGWKYEVDRLFRVHTLCAWESLSGKAEQLKTAFDEGTDPKTFVDEYIKKHGLSDCKS